MENNSVIQQLQEQVRADIGGTNVPTPQKKKFSLKEYAFFDLRKVIFLAVVPLLFIGLLGVGGFYLAQQAEKRSATLPPESQSLNNLPSITLPSSRGNVKGALIINVPTLYQSGLQVHGSASISGTLTAPNVIYSIATGTGLSSSGGQNPTLTNTGVLSLAGQTGALNLTAGDGIEISGLTISSPDQNVFKTIKVDSTSFDASSANDTLTFKAGTGVTLSTDTTGKSITITNSATGEATFWKQTGTTTHLKDITGNVGIGTTNATALLDVAGAMKVSGLFTLGSDAFSSVTGNGLAITSDTLQLSLLSSSDGTGATSSNSGLEFAGSGTGELALLQGCSDGQTLKWDDASAAWACANDLGGGGGGVINVAEGATTYSTIDTISFNASQFDVAKLATTANVTLDFTNSGITRKNQNEAVSGDWTFSSATPLTFSDTAPALAIGDTGTLTITDGTNTLFTLTDNGTTGSLSVDALTVSGLGTGLVKTDTNGTLSLAVAGTDYESPLTFSTGLSRSTNTISVSNAVPTSISNDTNVTGSIASHVLTLGWTGQLAISRGGTNSTAVPTGGAIAYGTGTAYAFSPVGSSGQVLVSGGGGAPSWQDASSVGINYWQRNAGSVSPLSVSDDLLLGSAATNSALIKLTGTAGNNSYINTGNVGIGKTNPGTKLDVNGGIAGNSGLTISSGTISLPAGQIDNSELANSSLTITAGSGLSGGGLVSLGSSISLSNAGVTSLTGTTNQVNVSGSTGAITISLPQSINTTSTPTFAGMTLSGALTIQAQNMLKLADSDSSNTIAFKAPATVASDLTYTLPDTYGSSNYVLTTDGSGGLSWQAVTGVGAGSGTITAIGNVSTGDAFTASGTQGTSLYFYDADGRGQLTIANLTAARTYTLPDESGTVCLTSGNCSGTGAGLGGSGTANYVAKFSGTYGLTDSSIVDNGNVGIGITNPVHKLSVVGTTNLDGAITTTSTISGLTGISSSGNIDLAALAAGGLVKADVTTGRLSIAVAGTDYQTPIAGGTYESPLTFNSGLLRTGNTVSNDGVLTLNGAKGALTLANANEASGTITIDNAAADGTTKGIATFNSTNFSASSGIINTVQNIDSSATPTFANLKIGTINLDAVGTSNITSGASLIGVYDEFANSNGTSVQQVLNDLDAAVGNATHDPVTLAGGLDYLQLTDQVITLNSIDLTTDITGILPIANGGTNKNLTLAAGGIIYSDADSFEVSAVGTSGQVLVSGGTGAPTWLDASTVVSNNTYFQRNLGSVSPKNITDDLLLGSTATTSALVRIPGLTNQNAYFNLGTGNVGIGITNPAHKLSVVGTTNITGATTLGSTLGVSGDLSINTNKFTVAAASGDTSIAGTLGISGLATFSSGISVSGDTITDFTGTGLVLSGSVLTASLGTSVDLTTEVVNSLPIANGGTNSNATPTAGAIAYGTGTAYAFSLAGTSGQVLISGGTGAPTWLDASTFVSNNSNFQRNSGAVSPKNITDDLLLGSTATTSALVRIPGLTNQNAYFNLGTGNVGIGTTAPSQKLTVGIPEALSSASPINPQIGIYNAGLTTVSLRNTTDDVEGRFVLGSSGGSIGTVTNHSLDLITGEQSRIRILNDGNVGIGTTIPVAKLDVNGTASVSGALTLYGTPTIGTTAMQALTLGSSTTGGINFASNGQTRMTMLSNGNFGIGVTNPAEKLDIAGKIAINSTPILYLPDQSNFTGSLVIGNGGSNLLHSAGTDGFYNTFLGLSAGAANTTGFSNTFVGDQAGNANTTGNYNSILGHKAGYWNTTGSENALLGYQAGYGNTTGNNNAFFGSQAGRVNSSGSNNTAIGYKAGYSNDTGSGNLFLGYQAGYNETGSDKLYISNSNTSSPLLGGSFSIKTLGINVDQTSLGNASLQVNQPNASGDIFTASQSGSTKFVIANSGNITTTGAISGLTGISSSGNIDLSALSAGGIVKAAITTGRLSIATGGTDYENPLTFGNGLTRSTNAVSLGGTLTGNTSIALSGFNLNLSGTGNLGIGTTTPGSNLQINGNAAIGYSTSTAGPTNGLAVSGNIGIGITNPTAKLDVGGYGTAAVVSNPIALFGANSNDVAGIEMRNSSTGTSADTRFLLADTTGNYLAFSQSGVNYSGTMFGVNRNATSLMFANGRDLGIGTFSNNSLIFGTNNAERLRITNAGNVGVGTTNPGSKLQVNGNAAVGYSAATAGPANGLAVNGNVGIGITNPTNRFVIAGSANAIQAVIRGGASQSPSNPLLQFQSSSGTPILSLTSDNENNVFLGVGAGQANTVNAGTGEGMYNTFIGNGVGTANTTGSQNTAIGWTALTTNTTGFSNTAVGLWALTQNTTGNANVAVGRGASTYTSTGSQSATLGTGAGFYNTTGSFNTIVGNNAGVGVVGSTTYSRNSILGESAGFSLTTGNNNLLLGYHAGYSLTSGANNILIGYNIDTTATTVNYLSIGNVIYGDLSGGNIGIGDSTPTEAKLVVGSAGAGNIYFTPDSVASTANALCWDGSGASTLMDCTSSPVADYMEMYPTSINTQMGDLVTTGSQSVTTKDGDSIKQLVKTTAAYQPAIGIISDKSKAGDFNSIGHNVYEADNPQPVALSGRVPVKVTTQNGQIHAGDFIATSTTPGVGMKATSPGYVVGQALGDYTNSNPNAVGTVMVFVKSIWHDPTVQIASNGTVQLAQQNGTWLALDESGNVIDNKGVFSRATIAELKTGKIESNDIFGVNLAVTSGIFDHLNASFVTGDSLTINDTLSAGRVTTDELSFADFKIVQIDNKLVIANKVKQSLVEIDENGATFSGRLTAKAVKADEGDIDTLTVKNLIVENITGLTSSASAEMNLGQKISSEFADFDFTKINTDLTVLGTTTLNNAVVQDTLGIGTELTMTSNSINTVSQDLEIQPLKQAAVDFLAGAVRIEKDGTVKFAENATFAKNVEVKGALTAKAVNVDQDTVIDISATESTASASAGMTTIRAGQTTRKINTPFAKSDSLIYVTPEGKTDNQVLYIAEKKDGSFTIEIEHAATTDILFNFLIVNKSESVQ